MELGKQKGFVEALVKYCYVKCSCEEILIEKRGKKLRKTNEPYGIMSASVREFQVQS